MILGTAKNADTAQDEVDGRELKRLAFNTHQYKATIRPKSLDAIDHGIV